MLLFNNKAKKGGDNRRTWIYGDLDTPLELRSFIKLNPPLEERDLGHNRDQVRQQYNQADEGRKSYSQKT